MNTPYRDPQPANILHKFSKYPLEIVLAIAVLVYLIIIFGESPSGFLQVVFNGVTIGSIYALVAIGFTLVYGTVWFFDLTYGAMAAMGGYAVFYLAGSQVQNIGRGALNSPLLNLFFGVLVAAVTFWAFRTWPYRKYRHRINRTLLLGIGALMAVALGMYTTFFLGAERSMLHIYLSPLIGVLSALLAGLIGYRTLIAFTTGKSGTNQILKSTGVGAGLIIGIICGGFIFRTPGANLYITWVVGPLLAGFLGLGLYRWVFIYILKGTRSNMGVLVGSLGLLLAFTAIKSVIFTPAGKTLPDTFGSSSIVIGGAYIKPFNIFVVIAVLLIFLGIIWLLKKTDFGKAVRAISDDAEVAQVVGINSTAIISVVFFIAAALAALGGVFFGEDNAIRPTFGFILLLKGWVASVVGGMGNIYGALLGGFILGLVENFGIWHLDAEWKNVICFTLLVFFLLFWPTGLLPRK